MAVVDIGCQDDIWVGSPLEISNLAKDIETIFAIELHPNQDQVHWVLQYSTECLCPVVGGHNLVLLSHHNLEQPAVDCVRPNDEKALSFMSHLHIDRRAHAQIIEQLIVG